MAPVSGEDTVAELWHIAVGVGCLKRGLNGVLSRWEMWLWGYSTADGCEGLAVL